MSLTGTLYKQKNKKKIIQKTRDLHSPQKEEELHSGKKTGKNMND